MAAAEASICAFEYARGEQKVSAAEEAASAATAAEAAAVDAADASAAVTPLAEAATDAAMHAAVDSAVACLDPLLEFYSPALEMFESWPRVGRLAAAMRFLEEAAGHATIARTPRGDARRPEYRRQAARPASPTVRGRRTLGGLRARPRSPETHFMRIPPRPSIARSGYSRLRGGASVLSDVQTGRSSAPQAPTSPAPGAMISHCDDGHSSPAWVGNFGAASGAADRDPGPAAAVALEAENLPATARTAPTSSFEHIAVPALPAQNPSGAQLCAVQSLGMALSEQPPELCVKVYDAIIPLISGWQR